MGTRTHLVMLAFVLVAVTAAWLVGTMTGPDGAALASGSASAPSPTPREAAAPAREPSHLYIPTPDEPVAAIPPPAATLTPIPPVKTPDPTHEPAPVSTVRPATPVPPLPSGPDLEPKPISMPPMPPSLLADAQLVLFYGRPGIPTMGIVGEYSAEDLVPLLRARALAYDVLNGPLKVIPGFHLIYAMAVKGPHRNGNHLSYFEEALGEDTLQAYIDLAEKEEMVVILDLQMGKSDLETEISRVLPYLEKPHVHLALDPEFVTDPDQDVPGRPPGRITAEQINQVQAMISEYLLGRGITHRKVFIVHQFLGAMIEDPEAIVNYPRIDLVINADGFGGPDVKVSKYNRFTRFDGVQYRGLKLFYRWDVPLLSEQQVLGLEEVRGGLKMHASPNVIIYQ